MKIYLLSPENVPMNPCLFPTMRKTMEDKGHSFVDRIEGCDLVFFDLHVRQQGYKKSDIDWWVDNKKQIATFDEWDRGNMSNEIWPYPLSSQQDLIFSHIRFHNIKAANFCRLLNKKDENGNVFPYEKPITYDEGLLTADQLFNREYDVCFIANTAPSRERIARALESDSRLKCIISLGQPKIEFNNFVDAHRKAKLFVSSGAGGFTDERKQCLFSIAGLIQEEHNQLLANPHTHLENCIKINNPPTKQDLDAIFEIVNDKGKLYDIYRNNCDFMHTYYSEEYMANRVLDILKQNGIE